MKNTKRKGFTIVELVIVIAVIAILAAVLIPTFASVIKKANESVDIQATKNMNTFLAAGNATGDVKSILDVYDIFEDSDYVIENYEPLYKGRGFFYSVEDKAIVYVDSEIGKVIFPEGDLKDTAQGNKTWLSLSMKGVESKQPAKADYTKTEASSGAHAKIAATVSEAAEYLYVIEQYNELSNNGATALDLELTISGTIDMKGTQCTISKANGTVTIKGDADQGGTLKNITSVETHVVSSANTQNKDAKYCASALIADADSATVKISGITLENAYVRTFEGGNVALLIGSSNGNAVTSTGGATIENVTIKNSEVIGHRSVGALVGNAQGSGTITLSGTINLKNVSVKTIGGKSGRLIGTFGNSVSVDGNTYTQNLNGKFVTTGMTLKQTNVTLDIYEYDAGEQTISNECPSEVSNLNASNPTKYITSIKSGTTTSTYPYFENVDMVLVKVDSSSKNEYFVGYTITSNN